MSIYKETIKSFVIDKYYQENNIPNTNVHIRSPMLGMGITHLHANKPKNLDEYIGYRNTVITRARKGSKYYQLRLIEIDYQYPQFLGLGIIKLKRNKE